MTFGNGIFENFTGMILYILVCTSSYHTVAENFIKNSKGTMLVKYLNEKDCSHYHKRNSVASGFDFFEFINPI